MNQSVTYLMDELCAGVEIYYTGRIGGQYRKTAFILCDEYSELVSKLFLLTDNPNWTDKKPNDHYKNYQEVLQDVEVVVGNKMPAHLQRVKDLQAVMKDRRKRRNDFFHSTNLLDLNVTPRNCVESLCDLLEYGEILLGANWRTALKASRNLATFEVMLQLEKCAFSDPSITQKVDRILKDWPRQNKDKHVPRRGTQYVEHPDDLHLRLCVFWGGHELREKFRSLLGP